jgi:uncharacterized membrane-anchored protein YjiN (DUF445 family)
VSTSEEALFAPASQEEQAAALRRMKAVPLALLIGAALLYLISRRAEAMPEAWAGWSYLRAMSEAGVVGGLADWFAVTALFRHPLRLPIPHTALIPRKKDQLGASLSRFVRENFLQPSTVRSRVTAAEPGLALGRYLAEEEHQQRIVGEAANLAEAALDSVSDADVQLLVRNTLFRHATQTALSPPLGRMLEAVVEDRNHTGLVDVLFRSVHEWLVANRADIIDTIATQGPVSQGGPIRWMHELVAARMYTSAVTFVAEVRSDPEHRTRKAIDDYLLRLSVELREDPRTIERIERWKLDLLEHEQTQRAVAELWPTLRRILGEALTDPDSELRRRMVDVVADFSERLATDEEYRTAFDRRAEDAVVFLVQRYGDEAVTVISDTVQRWDGQEASRRIELAVGRDLQFIRINGTVVGALVGLTIHTVSGIGL